jgi:hypothetical protein
MLTGRRRDSGQSVAKPTEETQTQPATMVPGVTGRPAEHGALFTIGEHE